MAIFVTGGTGYVGSHCVKDLCEHAHEVVVYDNLSKGHRQAVHPRARLVEGDLSDTGLLASTLASAKFDAAMHFAAFAEVGESVREPLRYYRNNVTNSANLLEALQRAGVRKVVFSSSCATYGVPPEGEVIVEGLRQLPISPYGRSKLVCQLDACERYSWLGLLMSVWSVYWSMSSRWVQGPKVETAFVPDGRGIFPRRIIAAEKSNHGGVFGLRVSRKRDAGVIIASQRIRPRAAVSDVAVACDSFGVVMDIENGGASVFGKFIKLGEQRFDVLGEIFVAVMEFIERIENDEFRIHFPGDAGNVVKIDLASARVDDSKILFHEGRVGIHCAAHAYEATMEVGRADFHLNQQNTSRLRSCKPRKGTPVAAQTAACRTTNDFRIFAEAIRDALSPTSRKSVKI